MRNTKKAFTLVELIVVITILAVLGTIAFVSLQGYSGEARDSKRLSDVNNLSKAVSTELARGTTLANLFASPSSSETKTIDGNTGTGQQAIANFTALKIDGNDFRDDTTNIDYPGAYATGWSGTGAYKFFQFGTISEAQNLPVVVGNYYLMATGDSVGLIGAGAGAQNGSGAISTVPGY